MLVPKKFNPPILKTNSYIARKLTAEDAPLDFKAVMSSIDIIHKIRGDWWPTINLTLEKNRIDLSWHEKEFDSKSSFAYTVMNMEETDCLGCIYLYPPEKAVSTSQNLKDKGFDVEISWWVTQKMYDQGFYDVLSRDIKKWVETCWPFKKIYWGNKELPKSFK